MTLSDISAAARTRALAVLGGFHPGPEDGVPDGCRTLLMLGPDEPRFWPVFTESAEYSDGQPDPMDRWSRRIIDAWAAELGAEALFPFGGPPYLPFYSWALRTERIHASPVNLLVHDKAGLFVSFRGALALRDRIELPPPPPAPCPTCTGQPCRSACPVDALTPAGYDVPRCKAYLDRPGQDCLTAGCRVRRACPVSHGFGRDPAQSGFHMRHFKGGET